MDVFTFDSLTCQIQQASGLSTALGYICFSHMMFFSCYCFACWCLHVSLSMCALCFHPCHIRVPPNFLSTCRRSIRTRWSSASLWVHIPPHATPSFLHPICSRSLSPLWKASPQSMHINAQVALAADVCADGSDLKPCHVFQKVWRLELRCRTRLSLRPRLCWLQSKAFFPHLIYLFILHRKWQALWLRNTCDLSSSMWVMCLESTFDRGIKLSDII